MRDLNYEFELNLTDDGRSYSFDLRIPEISYTDTDRHTLAELAGELENVADEVRGLAQEPDLCEQCDRYADRTSACLYHQERA